jgi:hypothetical protein
MLLSEGQMSDYKGAALMLTALPKAKELLGDKGYDADWFRQYYEFRRLPLSNSSHFLFSVTGGGSCCGLR